MPIPQICLRTRPKSFNAIADTTTLIPTTRRHLPGLDGLRGIAVLAVMAFHYELPFSKHGFLGVDVFFVISGFLITSLLLSEWRNSGSVNLPHFYMRRALRLFPALWFMLLVFGRFASFRQIFAALFYGMNWTMAFNLLQENEFIGHTWSLSVEEQYYLLWPVILIFMLSYLPPRMAVFLSLSLSMTAFVWRAAVWYGSKNGIRVYFGTDTHADGLLLGSALGLAIGFGVIRQWKPPVAGACALAMAVLLLSPGYGAHVLLIGTFLIAISTAGMIAGIVMNPAGVVCRVLETPLLAGIGTISYGIYLWHFPIGAAVSLLALPFPLALAIKIASTFIIATLSYRYIEWPILRVKGRFEKPLGQESKLHKVEETICSLLELRTKQKTNGTENHGLPSSLQPQFSPLGVRRSGLSAPHVAARRVISTAAKPTSDAVRTSGLFTSPDTGGGMRGG